MTFWNGTAWVADPAVTPPTPSGRPGSRRRVPVLTVAIGLLLLVPALAWSASAAPDDIANAASGPTVTLSGSGAPGQVVVIDGRGFKARAVYQVHWDSTPRAIRLVWPSAKGSFHGHLRIPGTATVGTHTATFSRVDRAAAVRVKAGTLSRSALIKTAPVVTVDVRVKRKAPGRTTPPSISLVQATSVGETTALVSWRLDEPATGQVDYGTTTDYGQSTTAEWSFQYTAHSQKLSGLAPGTLYHFRVRSQDAGGRLSVSSDHTFSTLDSGTDPTASPDPTTSPDPTVTPDPTASPDPTATPEPTAPPTATPAPTATPTRAPTPTPPPGVQVPSSIDATGSTDVSSALMSFIAGVPSGSTIVFKAGGTYRINVALRISAKSNLTFNGNGATIKAVGTGYNENYSLFYFVTSSGGNKNITVRNFNLVGSSPTPGVFISGKEGQHGILVDGGSTFDISDNTGSGFFGDFVEVNSGASGVHVHDNTITNTGRNGLSVIWGNHVEFDHNSLGHMGYMPFDVEPNTSTQPSSFVNIHDNATSYWSNAFFAVDGSSTGASIHDISVVNNTSTGKSLLTVVMGPARKQNITFNGNRSTVSAGGPVLRFTNVDGLTVMGNSQPLSSGALVSTTSCSSVTAQ